MTTPNEELKPCRLKFMVDPDYLKCNTFIDDPVRCVIVDPEAVFLMGILGESGREMVKAGFPFYFERPLAEKLIKAGFAKEEAPQVKYLTWPCGHTGFYTKDEFMDQEKCGIRRHCDVCDVEVFPFNIPLSSARSAPQGKREWKAGDAEGFAKLFFRSGYVTCALNSPKSTDKKWDEMWEIMKATPEVQAALSHAPAPQIICTCREGSSLPEGQHFVGCGLYKFPVPESERQTHKG